MNTVELNSINLQSIDVASNNVSSIGKSIKRNKGTTLLPAEYQQVEYIESTKTQWIDTGVLYNSNLTIEIKNKRQDVTSNGIFGVNPLLSFTNGASKKRIRYNNTTYDYVQQTDLSIDKIEQNKFYVDNVLVHTFENIEGITSNYTMYMFARRTNSSGNIDEYGAVKIYYVKITENRVSVRNFIPCYRKSDNEIGMYDVVNDVFYTNQGTGAFLKGADVNDKTYSTPYIKGHITTNDSTFTFTFDGKQKTVSVDANGDFKLKVKKPITSLSFVGVPQLESLELFAIDGVTTFDVDYPVTVTYLRCDSTTKSAKNDVYHIRGTATDDFQFTLKYIDDNNTVTTVTESAVIDENGKWDVNYSGKWIYDFGVSFMNNSKVTKIEITEKMNECVCLTPTLENLGGFYGCTNLTDLIFENGEFSKCKRGYNSIRGCSKLVNLDLSKANFDELTEWAANIMGCSNIVKLNLSNATFKELNTFDHGFRDCVLLEELHLEKAQPSYATFNRTFENCTSLTDLYVPNNQSVNRTISFQYSPLTYNSMLRVAGWIADRTGLSAQTVTFNAATYNALTTEQKAELEGIIVTQKGWVLATA